MKKTIFYILFVCSFFLLNAQSENMQEVVRVEKYNHEHSGHSLVEEIWLKTNIEKGLRSELYNFKKGKVYAVYLYIDNCYDVNPRIYFRIPGPDEELILETFQLYNISWSIGIITPSQDLEGRLVVKLDKETYYDTCLLIFEN